MENTLQKNVAFSTPRFIDNENGTVTDSLSGLLWLKDSNYFCTLNWEDALTSVKTLASGTLGLTDGSTAGQWRLPNISELGSLIDRSQYNPALPVGHPFKNVEEDNFYWSSSNYVRDTSCAWVVVMDTGQVIAVKKTYKNDIEKGYYVWPVCSRR